MIANNLVVGLLVFATLLRAGGFARLCCTPDAEDEDLIGFAFWGLLGAVGLLHLAGVFT